MTASETSGNVIAKYLPVYFVLLGIAGWRCFSPTRALSTLILLVVLLALACSGAALAVMYFMHLRKSAAACFCH